MSVIQSWQKSRTAEFSAYPGPSGTVITAKGELDAANAGQLTEFVERALRESRQLIVDLTGLDFIATAGFSTLHRINVACSGAGARTSSVNAAKPCGPSSGRSMGGFGPAIKGLDGRGRRPGGSAPREHRRAP